MAKKSYISFWQTAMNLKVMYKCLFELWQTVRKIAYCLERRHISANDAIFPNLQGVVNGMDGCWGSIPWFWVSVFHPHPCTENVYLICPSFTLPIMCLCEKQSLRHFMKIVFIFWKLVFLPKLDPNKARPKWAKRWWRIRSAWVHQGNLRLWGFLKHKDLVSMC